MADHFVGENALDVLGGLHIVGDDMHFAVKMRTFRVSRDSFAWTVGDVGSGADHG